MRFNMSVLGYKLIGINECDSEKVISRLFWRRVSASYSGGVLKVPISRVPSCLKALSGVEYKDLGSFGLIPFVCRIRGRWGILLAALTVMILTVFSSGRIFDIRVHGNEEMSVDEVEAELSRAGLFVGGSFRSLSLSEVETELLSASDKIGWININRRGTVAYVELREKRIFEDEAQTGYSNIVAAEDCVIEQITVKSGFAAVEVGDTVRRGDLLISGVLPAEAGGGFVNAEGVVLGRVYDENTVFVSRSESVEEPESDLPYAKRVKIFNFSINIFKKYRNYADGCVIIEDAKQLYLFGKYRLPISIVTERAVKYRTSEVTYSDDELIRLADEKLTEARADRLCDSEIVALRTEGKFTEGGYELTDKASIIRAVGEEKYFYN